jgi:hypothetical protein
MLFIVEITVEGNLGQQMNNMRTWLDHQQYGAISFRRASVGNPAVWRVDFETESEAREFAQAFFGRLLNAA